MRLATLAAALVLAAPLAARADLPASGTCNGTTTPIAMAGLVGLAVPQSSGTPLTVPSSNYTTANGGVFGKAECDCSGGNNDLLLAIKLTTAFPADQIATAEIWVGDSSCNNVMQRTSGTNMNCERILTPSIQDFTKNSTATDQLYYRIPAKSLTSPVVNMCDPTKTPANNVYLFIFNDPNTPLAQCYLTLSERLKGPDKVLSPNTSSGDSAVSVNWTLAPQGSFAPSFYQVLCADDCGNPIQDKPQTPIYSTCINGVLARRDITSGGSTPTGGTDGGTTTSTDMATMAAQIDVGSRLPVVANVTACDAAGQAAAHASGGVFNGGTNPLTSLNPAYICSGQISPSSTSTRVTGLTNGIPYHFVVLSVDGFGNATASDVIDGTPQPTEDLWRRYRADGGQGGCFIATAAFGSYESGWVQVLRDFRDEVLLEHDWGRSFVEWYYAHSPGMADWIAQHGWARALTRVALLPVIAVAWFWLHVPGWEKAFLLMLAIAFVLRKRIAARLRRGNAA